MSSLDDVPFAAQDASASPDSAERPRMSLGESEFSNASLRRLSHEWQLPDWDVLLVGDGSGSGAWHQELGIGWASVAVDSGGERAAQVGALRDGNVSLAELSAAAHGLWHYHNTVASRRQKLARALRVVVLCDNAQIVTEGNSTRGADWQLSRPDGPQWAFFNAVLARGYVATWRQIPRISLNLNWAVDQMAGQARKALQDPAIVALRRNREDIALGSLNPL